MSTNQFFISQGSVPLRTRTKLIEIYTSGIKLIADRNVAQSIVG